ncbi:MAG: RNA polymerase-associated protein RapA [Verrucomicrobia subdivision 3 bacterium]|nr:RNA polymerase-associated protein RapA [Limisphaerales bacterium]MCS1415549.1 RNA polymerase-associated protein RapA [Limisphaerales bacterium]
MEGGCIRMLAEGESIFFSKSDLDLRDCGVFMGGVKLSERFLAEIAGWEAMKQARVLLADGRILSGDWTPPVLRGVVQTGEGGSLRSGLVVKSKVDIENLCSCRQARQWGAMCAHSIGVGLRVLQREGQKEMEVRATRANDRGGTRTVSAARARGRLRRRFAASDDDVTLRLWAVFPPNWKARLAQGRVTLYFEGETAAGRRPLNAVPVGNEYRIGAEDVRLLDHLELLAGGRTPAMWPFDLALFAELVSVIEGHPRLSVGRQEALTVSARPWVPAMSVTLEDSGEVRLQVTESTAGLVWVPGKKFYVASDSGIQLMGLPLSCAAVLQGEVVLNRFQVPEFLRVSGVFLAGESSCQANFTLDQFEFVSSVPAFSLELAGGLARLRARIGCIYGSRVLTLGLGAKDETVWVPAPESKWRYLARDPVAEPKALNRVLRYGFRGPDDGGWYELRGQDAVVDFFAREYSKLTRDWEVRLEEGLQGSAEEHLETVVPRFEVRSSGIEWLDFRVAYASDAGTRFSEAEIQQWLLSGRAHRRLSNGKIAMLDTEAMEEFKEVLRDCAPEQRDGGYRIASVQAGFLDASIQELGWTFSGKVNWRDRVEALLGDRVEVPYLGALDSVLRDYQKKGVAWLDFLRRSEFGGILADEMGLGKTLQVLAMLRAVRGSFGPGHEGCVKALVVCPTSLVFNWVNEVRRFVPELRVLALQGQERKGRFHEIDGHDLTVTSYALIRRDLDHYRERKFNFVVLDEAQHIKNRETQNAKAVKAVRGKHRFVLTGTPMENSVLDLWSIFDFLLPGYLGSANDFRDRYEVPIVKEKRPEVMERLGRRLRPFVLRRTKREVAPELPEKLEQTVICPLNTEQREVYAQVMDVSRREVLSGLDQGGGKQRMMILNVLVRLRQICCDLRLLQLPETPKESSGKLGVFQELLEQVLDGNHRVLVFSQFVSMLHLMRQHLGEWAIEYCYLDGSTRDRGAVVDRFQKSSIPVFLISLKAGGTGLNLTGADTVIHFDPWWNPAIEDQATGRAHRIGQTRVVTSYKLIAEDTVEQKILQLQERKREMIEGALGAENQFVESLTVEDFRELFSD